MIRLLRGFITVAGMSLRTFLRDRAALFWGIAFPLMLMGLIGSVFGNGGDLILTTSVVGNSDDPRVAEFVGALKKIPTLKVVEEDERAAREALKKGDRSLVVVLPAPADWAALTSPLRPAGAVPGAAPSAPVSIKVYYDEGRAQVSQAGIAIVQSVVQEFNRRLTQRPDVLRVEAAGIASASHKFRMFDFLLPGILAMTIMQSGLMGVTWVVSTYRERRVLKRVLATPFPPAAFLAGLVARFTLTNMIQATIIMLVGVLVFHARVTGSLAILASLAVLGSLTFLAIGFAISTLSKTPEAANNLGSAIAFPMMFLSGTFWPKEMIPAALQPVIKALPLTPLVDAMRGVATQAAPLSQYAGGLAYMVAWMVAAFALATWRFRWE
ncbi:MAG: ABC transporter permease [Limnochordaceae bacterium]|nr:ABC transporter permease [Limnochordaceae bacterium]